MATPQVFFVADYTLWGADTLRQQVWRGRITGVGGWLVVRTPTISSDAELDGTPPAVYSVWGTSESAD